MPGPKGHELPDLPGSERVCRQSVPNPDLRQRRPREGTAIRAVRIPLSRLPLCDSARFQGWNKRKQRYVSVFRFHPNRARGSTISAVDEEVVNAAPLAREMGHPAPHPNAEETPMEGVVESDARAMKQQKIHIEQHSLMGSVWFAAWLFTIGFLHLSFWKGVLALVLWPYYIGVHWSALMH